MNLQEFGLLLLAVLISSCGQLFLKLGANQLGEVTSENMVSHVLNIAKTSSLNDGSIDSSLELLMNLRGRNREINDFNFSRNFGISRP